MPLRESLASRAMSHPPLTEFSQTSHLVLVAIEPDLELGDLWQLCEHKANGEVWNYAVRLESTTKLRASLECMHSIQGELVLCGRAKLRPEIL